MISTQPSYTRQAQDLSLWEAVHLLQKASASHDAASAALRLALKVVTDTAARISKEQG
jgi:hypothetical protein